jgi:hypothetical protein
MRRATTIRSVLLGAALLAGAAPAWAQQVLLEPVRAGQLTLFKDLQDDRSYYYVLDHPRLALGDDGKPQISILRWVENKRTDGSEPEAREGDGGGILHALVALEVTPEQIQQAQSDLQSKHPGAIIKGPVMYRQGTFGLVSSFKDPKGGLVEQVMGTGKAPLLDHMAAAVSMQLTKRGAQVLWESLQTPTPDISFTFEMELAGFRPPARAILEADFDQIYSHKAFAAGFASTHLGAEIEAAFDDLRRTGGIKLTEIGTDADLQTLIQTAYSKLAQVMFDSAPDILKPGMGTGMIPTQAQDESDSMMQKASALLAANRAEAAKSGGGGSAALQEARLKAAKAETDAATAEASAKAAKDRYDKASAPPDKPPTAAPDKPADKPATEKPASDKPAADGAGDRHPITPPKPPDGKAAAPDSKPAAADRDSLRKAYEAAQAEATRKRREAEDAKAAVAKLEAAEPGGAGSGKKDLPTWAAVASFKMKEVHQSGKMRFDLNKYTESTVTLRFDGNVGDVRQFKDRFREVNLSSPLYQQREVVVYVDGASLSDFGQYVNFVTVRLHKRHAGGQVTDDEVLIDRNNFNKEGNRFKLLYGWKGDNDRTHWMEYEYQTVWSLFGGKTVELPMQKATAQAIPVVPPYQRRTVELRGDAAALAKADVRSVSVKVFYDLGGGPQVRQATFDPAKPQSSLIEFMSLPGTVDYEYEVTWRLKGNRTVTSGRQKGSDAWLDLDDLPDSDADPHRTASGG